MIPFLSLLLGVLPAPVGSAAPGPPAAPGMPATAATFSTVAITAAAALEPPAPADTTSSPERWFAEDKLKHFFMSFAATSLAYGGVRTLGLDDAPGLAVAGGAAVTVGIGKEWWDRRAGGPFSLRDLAWDAAGVVVGLAIASQTR